MAREDGDGSVLDRVLRSVARTSEGLLHRNRLTIESALRGTLRWPCVTRAEAGSADRVALAAPAALRHHFTVGANAAEPYEQDLAPASLDAYDARDVGAAMRGVRVFAFKKPPEFAPHDARALAAVLDAQREQGRLRECDTDEAGSFRVTGTGFGEVVLVPDSPFRVLPPAARDEVRCVDPAQLRTHLVVVLSRDGTMEVEGRPWDGALYAVPMLDLDDAAAMRQAVATFREAFWLDADADVRSWILQTPMLDLAGVCLTSAERRPPSTMEPTRLLASGGGWSAVQRTLVRLRESDALGVVGDQLCHGYGGPVPASAPAPLPLGVLAAGGAETFPSERPPLRFVPLDDLFLARCQNAAASRRPENSRWLWGRFPLRPGVPDAEAFRGGDVAELQTRLILWDGLRDADWVHLNRARFDAPLARALVRRKHALGVRSALGTVSAVLDAATYAAIDRHRPGFPVLDLSEQGSHRFPDRGFDRYIMFGAVNACERVLGTAGGARVSVSSGFRSLPHNRHVYTQSDQANRLAHQNGQLVAENTPDAQLTQARGTYLTSGNANNPAEKSQHTFGDAMDFRFARPTPPALNGAQMLNQVHADYEQVVQFAARLANGTSARTTNAQGKDSIARVNGRLWLEPRDNQRRIHFDAFPVIVAPGAWQPDACVTSPPFFVFDDVERDGPRFTDRVVVYGVVTDAAGAPHARGRLRLRGPGVPADTGCYTDEQGRFVLTAPGTGAPERYELDFWRETVAWDRRDIAGLQNFAPATDRLKRANTQPTSVTGFDLVGPGVPVRLNISMAPLGDFEGGAGDIA
jgi:hypothetical protein